MVAAYLKIWVDISKERAVRDALRSLDCVLRADLTTGEQDIIALVEASRYDDLLEKLMRDVRSIDGIEKTVTNLVLE